MSFVSIATQMTLGQTIDDVRERTNTISEEESELYRIPLVNMIHDAILSVRSVIAQKDGIHQEMLKDFYWTEGTVTEASNLVDISTLDIWWEGANFHELTYFDVNNGGATLMTQEKFNNLKTIYSDAMMANFFIGYPANILATNNKFQIRTFRGSSLASAGALTLGYPRNPYKRTLNTDLMDATEEMMRTVVEMCVKQLQSAKVAA